MDIGNTIRRIGRNTSFSAIKTARKIARSAGVEFVRFGLGMDPFVDIQYFLEAEEYPLIFDVGANVGQSVDNFRSLFPGSFIHSFEPSPSVFAELEEHCKDIPDAKAWNFGVGSADATLTFAENEESVMSSFLQPSTDAWGKIVKQTDVPVVRLDSFAKDQNIDFIHVLKSDTQGYDFEVFKGASQLMKENRIGLIYFEFIFSDQYENLPSFDQVFRYLTDHNFALVAFYKQHFQNDLVSWTDALFINREFMKK